MSQESIVVLRIFSGTHLGAEIALPKGTQLLGEDDSCDIILSNSGLSARHAELHLSQTADAEGNVTVHVAVSPVDGAILVNNELLQDGAELPAQTPCLFGACYLAWAEPSKTLEAWAAVTEQLQAVQSPSIQNGKQTEAEDDAVASTETDNMSTSGTAENDNAENGEAEATDNNVANDVLSTGNNGGKEQKSFWSRFRTLRHLAFFLLGVMAFSALIIGVEEQKKPEIVPAEIAQKALQDANFTTVFVVEKGTDIYFAGRLANDVERGNLVQLARRLHFPVYIDVTVQADIINAMQVSAKSRGFLAEVYPTLHNGKDALLLCAYVKGEMEKDALVYGIHSDVPALQGNEDARKAPVSVVAKMLYAKDLQPLLEKELQKSTLPRVSVEYLPQAVQLSGQFSGTDKKQLTRIMTHIGKTVGVTVPFSISAQTVQSQDSPRVVETKKTQTASAKTKKTRKSGSFAKSLASMQVTSVSLGKMPFICLSSGEKVFIGGRLPEGYTLKAISIKTLTLEKNGKTTIYPLRGAQ